jgi:hypothetical protein
MMHWLPLNVNVWVLIGLIIGLAPFHLTYGSSTDLLTYDLEQARERLRVNQEFKERVSADLQTLKESKNADPDTIAAYEAYFDQIQAMVAEDRKTVARLESLNTKYSSTAAHLPSESGTGDPLMTDPRIPEEQVDDEVASLDRELNTSLAAFDTMLLTELELIKAKSAERMRDLAEEAAAAAERLKEKGIDLEYETPPDATGSGDEPQDQDRSETTYTSETSVPPSENNSNSQDSGLGENKTAKGQSDKTKSGSGAKSSDRDDRYAAQDDDDIVARQLREAAEKETDPELKEKLWKEYEAYKKNRRKTD